MRDETLIKLATVIYRFTLLIMDGIVAVDGCIVVSSDLRSQFLDKIHEPHLGIVKSKLLAKNLVYWPGYSNDVKTICEQCRENPIMPQNVPKFHVEANEPGEIYGCDIVDIKGNQHLVVIDIKVSVFLRENYQM